MDLSAPTFTLRFATLSNAISPPDGVQISAVDKAIDDMPTLFRDGKGKPSLCVRYHETSPAKSDRLAGQTHSDVYSVVDPLGISGETHIGLERAKREVSTPKDDTWRRIKEISKKECSLCDECREMSCLEGQAIAVNNGAPFAPLVHKLVVPCAHRIRLQEIQLGDLEASWEKIHEIAIENSGKLDGITVGMNFGAYALSGASQPHLHYQVAGIGKANHNAADRLGEICEEYKAKHSGSDYLEDYIEALRRSGLVIAKNPRAILYVPIAQRVKHELQIMSRRSSVGNILNTEPEDRAAFAELEHLAMRIYAKLGIEALNEVWYQSRFEQEPAKQRMIVSMYPRTAIVAFYELSGNHVVDQFPWNSAQELKDVRDQLDDKFLRREP